MVEARKARVLGYFDEEARPTYDPARGAERATTHHPAPTFH